MTNRNKRAVRPSLSDWDAKRSLLRALYGVLSDTSLITEVTLGHFKTTAEAKYDRTEWVKGFSDTLNKWHDGVSPLGDRSGLFWNWIIGDFELSVSMGRLWDCSIGEFVELFSGDAGIATAVTELLHDNRAKLTPDTRAQLQTRFGPSAGSDVSAEPAKRLDEYYLRGFSRAIFSGSQTGIIDGHIKSSQFFAQPEAADAWAKLIDSENYSMYLDCRLSLTLLTETGYWERAVGNGDYNSVVALGGGGSPEKDMVLATTLLAQLKGQELSLHYLINDISPYMLAKSVISLGRRIAKDKLKDRIRLDTAWCDLLLLDECGFRRESNWTSVVWAILGGTIGNVSELDFFRSIQLPSKVGDLLIVGLDTIGPEAPEAFEERMTAQYRSKELDELLLSPIKAPTSRRGGDEPVTRVTVSGHKGPNRHSDIPHSWTAVFSSPSVSGVESETILSKSTRYVLKEFIAYAERFRWEHLGSTAAPSDSTFRQLLLRRVP